MKKLYIILALALFTSVAAEAQVSITFRVTLKGTGKKLNVEGLRCAGALGATEQPTNWDPPTSKKMTLVGTVSDSIYAVTLTVTRPANNMIEYKFINGGNWGNATNGFEDETGVPAACAVSAGGNRVFTIPAASTPIILPAVRWNTCDRVFQTGVNELSTAGNMDIYPNPSKANTTLTFDNPNSAAHTLEILNVTGQIVRNYAAQTGSQFEIQRGAMPSGMYFARVKNTLGESRTVRFIME